MRECLAEMPPAARKNFNRAIYLRPSLENADDSRLHLMMLRAARFDPVKAARKLCHHFDCKQGLFGDAKLVDEVTLDDMDENDRRLLQRGTMQVFKDRLGRMVHIHTIALYNHKNWKSQLRATFYQLLMTFVEDEEAQLPRTNKHFKRKN